MDEIGQKHDEFYFWTAADSPAAGWDLAAKALIIGLDAASPLLLQRWTADGSLPTLAALRTAGVSGQIKTPPGVADDAVWASFYTGMPLGHHGRYFWEQLSPDARRVVHAGGRLPEAPPIWTTLSTAGKRVAVLDVPKVPVAHALNGIQLCDWLVHGRDYPEPRSFPEDFAASIIAEFGSAPLSICSETIPPMSDAETATTVENLLHSAAMKQQCATKLLSSDAWDLFVVSFK